MLSRMDILWIAMRLVDLFYQPGPPLLSPQMSPLHEFVRLAQDTWQSSWASRTGC